jgi:hypothetical protein
VAYNYRLKAYSANELERIGWVDIFRLFILIARYLTKNLYL